MLLLLLHDLGTFRVYNSKLPFTIWKIVVFKLLGFFLTEADIHR